MTSDFYILGTFVGANCERATEEDMTPQIFKKFIWNLKEGDELVLHLNSVGGDVYSGISIANMIKELNQKGVKTTAVVEGLAASIASVVACACKKIKMYESSFLMCHNCWSVVQGNSDQLRKEADVMDKINDAIKSFYHGHFNLSDEELQKIMDEETWISGSEAKDFKFDCEVIPSSEQFKIAASLKDMHFNKIPKGLIMEDEIEKKVETEETEKETSENPDEEKQEVVETEKSEDTKPEKEETSEETTSETEEEKTEVKDEVKPVLVPQDEVEKRVSGMQSTMAKKMDALKKEYENKITDFKDQLKAKDEELIKVKAEITSLTTKLEDSAKELQMANDKLVATASALEEKSNALATLNANVNTPNEEINWKNLKGKEFFDWLKKHPELSKTSK